MLTLPVGANGGLHEPSFRPPFDAYILPSPSIFGRGSALLRVRLKTAAVSGAIDCALRLHYALRRHPSCVGGWLAPFRLWLQTIFAFPFPLASPTPPASLRCRCATIPMRPGNLRLPFRLVRTGICSPASNRREPPFATNLPPGRGLMNARCLARGTRLIYRRGQECRRQCFRPHPECGFCNGLRPLIPFSAPRPQPLPSPSIFGRRLRFAPLSTKNRYGLRGDRLRPPLATTSATSLARCGFATAPLPAVTNYLQRLRSRFAPPPLLCRGVGPLHSAVDPKPPLTFPTCQCRCATLRTPIAPAPYCQPRSSHPQRCCRLHSKPSAFAPTPSPDVRCADVLTLLRQTANRLCQLRVASGTRHGGVG